LHKAIYYFYTPVPATSIILTPSHTGLVAENVDVTLSCTTDEGNPTPSVTWKKNGVVIAETSGSDINGNYNAKKRDSLLTIRTNKTLNGVKYQCFNGPLQPQEYILQVKCK
jgi:hypothetical protein